MLQLTVAYLGHAGIVAFAFGALGFESQLFHLLLGLLHLLNLSLFAFPLGAEVVLFFAQFGNVFVQLGYLLRVVLTLDGLTLNFQLSPLARDVVQFLGHRVAFHAQLGGSLVHQVDGLVGQEPVADVALG